MVRVLDDAELAGLISPSAAVGAMRSALLAFDRGDLEAPPRVSAGVVTLTAGRLVGRWYGYRCYDTHLGGEQAVALHTEPGGDLAALAVGTALGESRTGALGAVAADLLARPDCRTVGVIGAGRQAWTQLWAISTVRELTEVTVYSPTVARRRALVARVQSELGIRAIEVPAARAAVEGRDLVILATTSTQPVLDAGWLAPGTAVSTLGPKQVGRAEFGPDLPERAGLIVTDSPAQLRGYEPPPLLAGVTPVSLAAVLAGRAAGRRSRQDITLYASVGLAGTEPYLLAELLGL